MKDTESSVYYFYFLFKVGSIKDLDTAFFNVHFFNLELFISVS